jgi:hypothetical protein
MNRSTLFLIIATIGILTLYSLAQWQVQPQIDTRVGPIYPQNPSYNFRTRGNSDPFQFNWYTGRFDYVPIPYNSAGSSNQNWQYSPPPSVPGVAGSVPQYVFGGPPASNVAPQPSAPSPTAVSPNIPSVPTPDDTTLWMPAPATQPSDAAPPKPVTFEGRICGIRAADLMGDSTPELLMRLRSDAGAIGTVDVGERLIFPQGTFDSNARGYITATGMLGALDGHLILFAQKITIGKTTIPIDRDGMTNSQK